MNTILDKIKKTLEDGYDTFRDGASVAIEKAEDFGKLSKLKFELRQLSSNLEKKLAVLGDAVYPHLLKPDPDALKDNPAVKLILDEIQAMQKDVDAKQKEIDAIVREGEKIMKERNQEKLQKNIEMLEKEIEEKMDMLKKLRGEDKKAEK